MGDIDKTIKMRTRRLEVENSPCHDLHPIGKYILVESNRWYGVKDDNSILVRPIYDSIDVFDDIDMCIMKLRDTHILYDLLNSSVVDLPKMNTYQRYGSVIEVRTENGVGLFSCRLRKLLIPAKYAETTHNDRGRYLWVMDNKRSFAFFDIQSSAIVKCPEGTSMCLETDKDLMFVVIDNEVKCINESGIIDNDIMRMLALDNGGRIKLNNNNKHCTVIADIYGHIIN